MVPLRKSSKVWYSKAQLPQESPATICCAKVSTEAFGRGFLGSFQASFKDSFKGLIRLPLRLRLRVP